MNSGRPGTDWKRDLEGLLSADRLAVVGASERSGVGQVVMFNLQQLGFKGSLYPVNPKYQEVFGHRCYPDLASVPGPVDAVAVAVAAHHTPGVVAECARLGIRACTVMSSGFAELDEKGTKLQEEICRIAEEHHIRLCGPNCLGHLNLARRTGLYSAGIPGDARPGKVALVSQSGSMAIAMFLTLREVGISHVISYGNQAVLGLEHYLEYLADDENTDLVAVFMEGLLDGHHFLRAAGKVRERGKPLVVLKIGRSRLGQEAARSHTGALAGSDRVYQAAFRQAGVLACDDLDELVQTVKLVSRATLPPVQGVAVLGISGGQCGLIADIAAELELEIPRFHETTERRLAAVLPPYLKVANPLDVALAAVDESGGYSELTGAAAEDPRVGVLLISQDAPAGIGPTTREHYTNVMRAIAAARDRVTKPIVVFSNHSSPCEPGLDTPLKARNIPYLQGTRPALKAVKHLLELAHYRTKDAREAGAPPVLVPAEAVELARQLASGGSQLTEADSKRVLCLAGIPVPRERVATSAEEALAAFRALGPRVALKVHSPDVGHKSDVGGVRLGLGGEEEVLLAFREVRDAVSKAVPSARIEGVLVQEMAPDGLDLFIGLTRDLHFGPVLLCGMGGLYVELYEDVAACLAPLDRDRARETLGRTRAGKALAGARSRQPYDIDGLVEVMVRVSALFDALGESVAQLDLNPVRVTSAGLVVLDALMIMGRSA